MNYSMYHVTLGLCLHFTMPGSLTNVISLIV